MAYYLKAKAVVKDVDTGAAVAGATVVCAMNAQMTSYKKTLTANDQTFSVTSYYQYFQATAVPAGYTFDHFTVDCSGRLGGLSYPTSADYGTNPSGQWSFYYNASSCQTQANALAYTVTLWLKADTPPVQTVTLTYDANGGDSTPVPQSADAGTAITLAAAIARGGYNFAGWRINGTTYAAGATYTLSADVTAVAQWSQVPVYEISFAKGRSDVTGADVPTIAVSQGMSVTLPDAGLWSCKGYAFIGWATSAGSSVVAHRAGDVLTPTASLTLYAVWAATAGTAAKADYRKSVSTTTTEEETSNYNFRVSSNVPTGLVEDDVITISYQTKAFPRWTTTTTTYNPNSNPNPTVSTVVNQTEGNAYTTQGEVPAGTDETAANPDDALIVAPVGPLSFTSFYKPNTSSAYYTTTRVTKTMSVSAAWKWTAPEIDNFEFDGWYTIGQSWASSHAPTVGEFSVKISDQREVTFGEILAKCNYVRRLNIVSGDNQTQSYYNYVRLRYVGVSVLVLFDAAGGELDDFYRVVRYARPYGALPVPTRKHHTFVGWYTAASGGTQVTESTIVSVGAQHTLYARWQRVENDEYRLHFDAAGGTVSPTSRLVAEGSAYGTLPTPTRPDYSFVGWYTLPESGTAVTASTVMGDADAVIYAQWRGRALTLTFDAAGGTCAERTRTVYYGSPVGTLPTATKDGARFGGWYTAGGEKISSSSVLADATTVTARWTASGGGSTTLVTVRYKIRLELDGGTLDPSYECKYTRGYAKALPTARQVTRTGKTFGGWYADAAFGGAAVTQIPAGASGTRTYYVKWV